MEKCLIEWKPINTMLMKIRMKGKHINITIIQCYSLNNHSETKSRGFIKVLCRSSVGCFSHAFLVFLMKGSKKRRQKQPGKLMAMSRSQPVNLPNAWPLMNPLDDLNEDDDKERQAGLHESPGNSSRRGHQQGRTRTGVQDHQARQQSGDTDTPIVDKQGKLLSKEAEQEARWAQYFSEFLNRPQPRRLKQK